MAYYYSDETINSEVILMGGSSSMGTPGAEPLEVSGATLTLVDGGSFYFEGCDLYSGSGYSSYQSAYILQSAAIVADFTTNADAITSDCPFVSITIAGTVDLKNANISLGAENDNHEHDEYAYPGFSNRIAVEGTLKMDGGNLTIEPYFEYEEWNELYVYGDATVELSAVNVDASIYSYGTIVAENCEFAGSLTISVPSSQTLADVLQGSGNTFTQQEILKLSGYSGDFSDVWSFVGEATHASPHVAFYAAAGKEVQVQSPPEGYEHVALRYTGGGRNGQVTIAEGSSVEVAYVSSDYASIKAEFAENADAIVAVSNTSASWYKYAGTIDFKNANINLSAASGGTIYLNGTSALKMQDGALDISKGAVTLSGTSSLELKDASLLTKGGVTVNNGANLSLDTVDVAGAVAISAGASADITNTKITELKISLLAKELNISGNDFSSASITLLDTDAGGKINLSGNSWGTTEREVVLARFGELAEFIYLGELEGEFTGTETFTVTNTNDSGTGSLRAALDAAAAYSGTKRTQIVFDPALAGQSIHLASDVVVRSRTSLVNVEENPVLLEGGTLHIADEVRLDNMVLDSIVLAAGVALTGSNNVLCGAGEVVRVEAPNAYLGLWEVSVSHPDTAYINVACGINSGVLGLDSLGIPYRVMADAEMMGATQVNAGEHLIIDPGVCIDWSAGDLTVDGRLTIKNEENADALIATSKHDLIVKDGGVLELSHANIDLCDGRLYLGANGATVTQTGGTLDGHVYVANANGVYYAEGVEITGSVRTSYNVEGSVIEVIDSRIYGVVEVSYADVNVQGSRIDGSVSVSNGEAVLSDTQIGGKVSANSGNLSLTNCTIDGYLEVGYNADKWSGGGNVLTGDKLAQVRPEYLNYMDEIFALVSEIRSDAPYVEISSPFDSWSDITIASHGNLPNLEYRLAGWRDELDDYDSYYHQGSYDSGVMVPFSIVRDDTTLTLEEGATLTIGGGGGTVFLHILVDEYQLWHYHGAINAMVNSSDDLYLHDQVGYYTCTNLRNGIVVRGKLKAQFAEAQDAIVSTEDYVRVAVGAGDSYSYSSELHLQNGNICLEGEQSDVVVSYDASATMEGGSFSATDGWKNAGTTSFDSVEIRSDVSSSGTLNLKDTVHSGSVTLADGSTASILDTMGITLLTVEGSVSVSAISNNDFSLTTIDLSDYSGPQLDLSGNYWGAGVDTAEEIENKIIGYSASKVRLDSWLSVPPKNSNYLAGTLYEQSFAASADGETLGYVLIGNVTIAANNTVTLEEGAKWDLSTDHDIVVCGSLVASNQTQADALCSQSRLSDIQVASGGSLLLTNANVKLPKGTLTVQAGGTLSMSGGILEATQQGLIVEQGAGATLSGVRVNNVVNLRGSATLTDNTFGSYVLVSNATNVSGSGNAFSQAETLRLSGGFSGDTADLLGLIGSVSSNGAYIGLMGSIADSSFAAVSADTLPEGYVLVGDVTIQAGARTQFAHDARWNLKGHELYVAGVLEVENETAADALISSEDASFVYVTSGGALQLTHANIELPKGGVEVRAGAELTMSGGCFNASGGGLSVNSGASATLAGVDFNSVVLAHGTCSVNNNTFSSYLGVRNAADVSGSGNSFRTAETLRLSHDFSGNTADLFALIGSVPADAYISLAGSIATSNFAKAPALLLPRGYVLAGNVTIAAGATTTFENGCKWELDSRDLSINGTLIVDNDAQADAIVSSKNYSYIYVNNGGKLQLTNANVSLPNGTLELRTGASLEMNGGSLEATQGGLSLAGGSTSMLSGVEVKNAIVNSGAMTLTDCRFNGKAVTVAAGASATIQLTSGISTLTLNVGSAPLTIVENDFSQTNIVLRDLGEGEVIDLSGNYWGTTDMAEIISKIDGYVEDRVLISSILSVPPMRGFSFASQMYGVHRVSDTATKIVLTFNCEVDAATVNAQSIILLDAAGNPVAVESYEVNGNKISLQIAPLPHGQYTVQATEALRDVSGNAFTPPTHDSPVSFYSLSVSSPKVALLRPNTTVTGHFSHVDIFFDQVLAADSISQEVFHLFDAAGNEISILSMQQAGVKGNTFYRIYFDAVTESGTYQVKIDSSVCNEEGICMEADSFHPIYVSSPDLAPEASIDCSANQWGRYTTISYAVANAGDGVAKGSWIDSIYLCKSETWNEDEAILFARVAQDNRELNAGDSYTASATALLDGVAPGQYYVFVKSDMSSSLYEGNEKNNISATGTSLSVAVAEHALGVQECSISSLNESIYYSYTATENATLSLKLGAGFSSVKVFDDADDSGHTLVTNLIEQDGARVAYFAVEAGKTYYIQLQAKSTRELSTELQKAPFSLMSSSAYALMPGKSATFTIQGASFEEGMSVWLEDAAGNRYEPVQTLLLDQCSAKASFVLPATVQSGSQLTLVAQSKSGDKTELHQPIVVSSYADALSVKFYNGMNEWSGAAYSRVGFVWKTDLDVRNKAGYDLENAIILVDHTTAEDFAMYYGYDDAKARDRSALLFMVGNDEDSPLLLESGEKDSVQVYIKAYREEEGAIQAWVLQPGDDTVITAERWLQMAQALRPTNCDDATWNAWWADMQPRIGSTVGDFVSFIHDMQSLSVQDGQPQTSNLSELTAYIMENRPDYAPAPLVYGRIIDSTTGEPQGNVEVILYVKNGDEWSYVGTTYTDENGLYRMRAPKSGEYIISLPNAQVDMDGDGYPEADMSSFEISDGDVEVNAQIIPYLDSVEIVGDNTLYAASSKGLTGRLTNYGGQLWFAAGSGGNWGRSIQVSSNQINNYLILWDESLSCYVLFWEEPHADGVNDVMVQTIRVDEHGNTMSSVAVPLCSVNDAAEYVSFAQLEDGNYTLIVSEQGNISYADFNLSDDKYHEELIEENEVSETSSIDISKGISKTKTFRIPLIDYAADVTWSIGPEYNTSQPCQIDITYGIDGSISTSKNPGGQYAYNTLTFTAGYTDTWTYSISSSGDKLESHKGGGSLTMSVTFDYPQALIEILKKTLPVVGGPLFALKTKLAHLGIQLLAGIKGTLTLSYSGGAARLGGSVTLYGGARYKDEKDDNVIFSGTLFGSFAVDVNSLSIIPNSAEYGLSLSASVSIPIMWGSYYKGEYSWSYPKAAESYETKKLKLSDNVVKHCTADSAKVSGQLYIVQVDAENEKSVVKIVGRNDEVIDLAKIGTGLGPLASGKGYITDVQCYALGDALIIELDGYDGNIDEVDFPAAATIDELVKIKSNLESFRRTEKVRIDSNTITCYEDEQREDCICRSKVYKAKDGQVYRAEVYKNSDGSTSISLRTMLKDGWNIGQIAYTSKNEIISVSIVEENGSLMIHSTERTSAWENVSKSFVVKDGGWEEMGKEKAAQTGGITESIASFLGFVNPWAGLVACKLLQEKEPEPEAELEDKNYASYDPNDIYGPAGYGAANWIAPQEMQFQVVCENKPEENIAHAAMVTITQQIDAAFDYSTFRLGDMMIAGNYITVEGDVQSYKSRVDWTSTLGVWVDVNAWFDADTGIATWEFVAIDPATGYVVADPFTGLLAPNYNPPEGDGGVYYYVAPKSTAASGTEVKAQASIIFDYNDPIETPTLSYTLDMDKPEAVVQALAETSNTRYLRVAWEGSDVGSGVAYYNVFVAVDDGDWELWQGGIRATSALYTVAEGEHEYSFFAQGVDYAGNAEEISSIMMVEASTLSLYHPANSTLAVSEVRSERTGDELTLTLVFNEAATCADWSSALCLVATSGEIDLSQGTFRYDEAAHTLTWVGTVAGVADGEKAELRLRDGMVKDAAGATLGVHRPSFAAPVSMGEVAGSAYAAPTLADYNGDGLVDMLVGENAAGQGKVRIYLNEGSAEVASYATYTYAETAEGTALTVAAEGCQGAIVRLADLTGDGVAEMVIGQADGTVQVYSKGVDGYWAAAGALTCMQGGKSVAVDVGTRAAIEFADANGDGRSDMLVGTGDGNIVLYLNTASEGASVFDQGQYLHDSAGRIKVGSRASIATGDVDGDGLWDLLVGSSTGSIRYYRNEGSAAEPLFAAGESILAGDASWDMRAESDRLRLSAADVNGDGALDIAVGLSDGSVKVLYGTDGSDLLGELVVGRIPLPDAPQNLQIAVEGSAVSISWEAVTEENGSITYELSYQAEGAAEAVVLPLESTSIALQLPDGVYTVQVRALNHGKGGEWSPVQSLTVDTVAPEVPAGASANGGESEATISWSPVADAASYEVRYRSATSGTWRIVTTTESSLKLTDMPPGDYLWQIRAADATGNTSDWSSRGQFTITGDMPDCEQYWADGLVFDASGNITGGYYDVNKQGNGDSQMCWAAAASNVLAWWQEQGNTAQSVSGVPGDADSIYATFGGAWENASGVDMYGFIWWLSGDATHSGYSEYHGSHSTGTGSTGGYYNQYYTPQSITQHTAQVNLLDTAAETLCAAWNDIYAAGGMITLGVYSSIGSNGTLNDGHSLTMWGYETNADTGRLTEIYVTDSDDSTTALLTFALEYDERAGLYRIATDSARLGGFYLGTYAYLKGFTGKDIVAPEVELESIKNDLLANGSTRLSLRWKGAADTVRYELFVNGTLQYSGTAAEYAGLTLQDGKHSYTIKAVDAAGNTGEVQGTLWVDTVADNRVADAADLALSTPGDGSCGTAEALSNWVGTTDPQDYYRISAAGSGSYSIGIDSAAVNSPLWLSVGTLANGAYVVEQELLIKPDSAIHTLSGLNLQTDETYYIRVQAEEGSLGSEYAISVRGDLTDASHISANNSVAAATKLEASDDAEGSVDSWVGAGDALDYYCLEMAEDGRLSINLSGLEKNAKVRVYRQREDGAVTQTLSATAKAEGGLDRTLSLTAGTYFIEVAAYDNGAGRYNSTYALELEKEDESGSKQSFTIANA